MAFKIAARTILHLGAELISSDGIAFYELIKNAFDAGSKRAKIDIVIRIAQSEFQEIRTALLRELKNKKQKIQQQELIANYRDMISSKLISDAPELSEFNNKLKGCESILELISELDDVNYIQISDTGEGMSMRDLVDTYLTIGTRSRYVQRKKQIEELQGQEDIAESSIKPVLGEKGVGRLSAMRLGQRLRVTTSKQGESNYSILDIDWGLFSHESDALLEDVNIEPQKGEKKDIREWSGTTLRISRLESEWSVDKLTNIVSEEFSKLIDPFNEQKQSRIVARFNEEKIPFSHSNRLLFDNAHANVQSSLTVTKQDVWLTTRINYLLRKKEQAITVKLQDLLSISQAKSIDTLKALGPFNVQFYWFNRKILEPIEGIGEKQLVKKLVAQWAGGLMVYRDGFRVNPYGGLYDDWLDLDKKAFASGGYKVNRQQIIGKVDISSVRNPALVDQTNREGLRDTKEKRALVSLLQYILTRQFKKFIQDVDDEVRAQEPVTFDDLEERVGAEEQKIRRSFKLLLQEYPKIKENTDIIRTVQDAIRRIRLMMKDASELATSYQKGKNEMVHLAGLGLMVEILAHEIGRATAYALKTLNSSDSNDIDHFSTLEAQLKTLHKRIKVLDPLSTSGRQRKEKFDLVEWIKVNLDYHAEMFRRHHVQLNFTVFPDDRNKKKLYVTAVKGMIVQVLENLISNSMYWLKQQKKVDPTLKPRIDVHIDANRREIQFRDNGPGIEVSRQEEIFQPFVSTKPPGEGRGLGLYISREIAKYNDAALYLSDNETSNKGRLNTFIFHVGAQEE